MRTSSTTARRGGETPESRTGRRPAPSLNTFRADPLYPRIERAVAAILEEAYSRHFAWPGKGPFRRQVGGVGSSRGVGVARGTDEVLQVATSGITLILMPTISLKLPPALLRELEAEATAQGVSKSQIVRQFLHKGLRPRRSMKKRPSCLDLVADLAGAFNGPADLSTNTSYLDEALTAEHRRGRKNHR